MVDNVMLPPPPPPLQTAESVWGYIHICAHTYMCTTPSAHTGCRMVWPYIHKCTHAYIHIHGAIIRTGSVVDNVMGFLPPPPGCRIGVGIFSYAGRVNFTLTTDQSVIDEPKRLLAHIIDKVHEFDTRTGA